jgi:hypothetical protein
MLLALQIVHTLILVFNEMLAAYLVWCAVTGRGGRERWYAAIWLSGVLLLIIACGCECPLQRVARWITGVDHPVRDLLTPHWVNLLAVPVTIPIVTAAVGVLLARRPRAGAGPAPVRAGVAGVAYFALMLSIGFALGTLRTLIAVPQVGEVVAVLIEVPVILTIAWMLCGWLLRRFALPRSIGTRLLMGGIAFLLLMLSEIGLSIGLFGRSLAEHLSRLTEPAGLLGLAGQVAFAAIPLVRCLRPRSAGAGNAAPRQ